MLTSSGRILHWILPFNIHNPKRSRDQKWMREILWSESRHVLRGKKDGPHLFVSAAIHGDEIIGVEIIRRLLKLKILQRLRGTLIAVPVVNVYGFINNTRYLPDRRDLNRFFPGSEKGSLTSRLANIFMEEISESMLSPTGSWYRPACGPKGACQSRCLSPRVSPWLESLPKPISPRWIQHLFQSIRGLWKCLPGWYLQETVADQPVCYFRKRYWSKRLWI